MYIPFRQGIVQCPSINFLNVTNHQTVDLSVAGSNTSTVILTFSANTRDYLYTLYKDVHDAWDILPAVDQWLYWNIDNVTGEFTYGKTLVQPISGSIEPTNPVPDQHWFDITTHTMKVWSGNLWLTKIRLFAAKLSNGSVIVSVGGTQGNFIGTQVGDNTAVFSGHLVFDSETGQILKRADGSFVTTEDQLTTSAVSSDIKISNTVLTAIADHQLPAYSIVKFTEFGHIDYADIVVGTQTGIRGIIEQNVMQMDSIHVVTSGIVTNSNWDWSNVGINTPLYNTDTGQLTNEQQQINQLPIAMVLDKCSIMMGTPQNVDQSLSIKNAAYTTAGITMLSVPPADPKFPIAVGINDNILTAPRLPLPHTHLFKDITDVSLDEFITTAGGTISGKLQLSSSPTAPADATTKQYVDNQIATAPINSEVLSAIDKLTSDGIVVKSGNSATTKNITSSSLTVTNASSLNIELPTVISSGVYNNVTVDNKGRVISGSTVAYLPMTGGTLTGQLTLNQDPIGPKDAATKQYTDTKLSTLGGTMIGPLFMSEDPVYPNETATKQYTDTKLSLAGGTLTGPLVLSSDPSLALGAATKQYVDKAVWANSSITWKTPVKMATTTNISLSGLIVVDGVTTQSGDRILVKNQTNATQNGIYIANSGLWSRSSDANNASNLINGTVVYVLQGATQSTQCYVLSNVGIVTVGTSNLIFTLFNNNQNVVLTGDVSGTGTTLIPVTLSATGVAAGTYTSVTVDSKGRVTHGTIPTSLAGYNITDGVHISGDTMTGYLTLVSDPVLDSHAATKHYVDQKTSGPGVIAGGGLSLVGSTMSVNTASSSRIVVNSTNIDLATTGVTAGTYNSVTVDVYGRVTNASTVGNSLITLSGDAAGSGTSTIAVTLANSGVTAGTYNNVAVDSKGRVTAGSLINYLPIAGGTMTGNLVMGTSDTDSTANKQIQRVKDPVNPQDVATKNYVDTITGTAVQAGNGLTFSGSTLNVTPASSSRLVSTAGSLDLAKTGVTAGTYSNVTVDVYGRITNATNPTPVNQPITLTGDASGTGTTSIPVTLANSGVTAGTYTKVNVNAKGVITAGSAPTLLADLGINDGIDSLNDVQLSSPTNGQLLVFNNNKWINASPVVAQDRYVGVSYTDTTPGYLSTKLSFSSNFSINTSNSGGNEVLTIQLSQPADLVSGGPYNTFHVDSYGRITSASNSAGSNQPITLSGDATGTGTTSIGVTLADTGIASGTYKSVTVDTKGRAIAGTNPTTLSGYGITDAQPLNSALTNLSQVGNTGMVAMDSGTIHYRTIVGTTGQINVTNGAGNYGNPVVSLVSGIMATPGTYAKLTVDTYGRVIAGSYLTTSDISGAGTMISQNANSVNISGGAVSGTAIQPRIGTVSYASNTIIDWSLYDIVRITLTGDVIITNTNAFPGQKCIIELYQDSTGNHSVAFSSETRFGTDITGFTATTTPNKMDRVGLIYNEIATKYDVVAVIHGF